MATERVHQQGSIASLRKHLPVRKISARYTTKPPSGMPEFEMLKPSGNSASIVVAVTENRPSTSDSIPEVEEPESPETKSPPIRPQPPPLTIPAKAQIAPERKADSPGPSSITPSAPRSREASAAEVPLPRSSANTPDLDRKGSQEEEPAETPVMRSMFPSYNPDVSLGQQHYYPNMDAAPGYSRATARLSSNNPYAQQMNRGQTDFGAPSTAVKEPKESPLRRSESLKHATAISTPEELLELWSVSNGQDYEQAADSYTLELSCEDLTLSHEVITFSSSGPYPIYTLTASPSPASTINITRTHPSQTATQIPICVSTLSNPSRQDPLLCSIFPKLAGLMALDQSSTVAMNHKMTRSASDLLQNEAITRAQEREASMLLWDADSGRYCIMHPTLLDNTVTSLPIEITPNPSVPQLIVIGAPETNTPLLTLDLQALTLKLHTQAITALPSLYVLDTLVTALLSLLLHLHRSCAAPRSLQPTTFTQQQDSSPYFPPPPPSLHSNRSHSQLRQPKQDRGHSQSRASLFRSNRSTHSVAATTTHSALASPTPWASVNTPYGQNRDIELGELSPEGTSLETVKQKAPKGTFAIDDEGLPAGTRAVLKFLYWVFEVVYWLLAVLVQLLAAAVVAGGKLVTKL